MNDSIKANGLHPLAIGQIFASGLYLIDNEWQTTRDIVTAEAQPEPTAVIGGYRKSVLILVENHRMPVLADEDFTLLTKILGAVGLSMDDVLVVNTGAMAQWTGVSLAEKYKPTVMMLFGLSPEQADLPIRFPQFQVQPWAEIIWLHAPSLASLQLEDSATQQQKRQLWHALQRIFLDK